MAAVVPFIPLIVGGITAGGAIASNKMQANAQNKSSDRQLAAERESVAAQERMSQEAAAAEKKAADDAMRFQTEARDYDREAARLAREDYLKRQSPYIEMGNQAFGRLSELLNIPTNGAPPMGASMSASSGPAPVTGGAGTPPAYRPTTAQSVPMQGSAMSSLAAPSSATQAQPSIGAGSSAPAARGVQMRAPTGEIGIVPYDKVAQAITAGARRVS